MVLKMEDNHTLEWVDIDPEAFTGTFCFFFNRNVENENVTMFV